MEDQSVIQPREMKMKKYAIAVLLIAVLAACGKKEVSFSTLEDARGTARDNGEWNAKKWRAQLHSDWDIISRGDSSQTPDCPQGDGWATIDLINPEKNKKLALKCSTVSPNIGCLESTDFKTKAYASEDGRCQATSKVPFPLPKVAK